MNKQSNSALLLVPLLLLGLVAAVSSRPPARRVELTQAQKNQLEIEKSHREQEMLEKQWKNHLIELQIMKEQLKRAKHVIIQNGHRVPSETDESDSWFKRGKPDGVAGIKAESRATRAAAGN
jgi:hypothetical protein